MQYEQKDIARNVQLAVRITHFHNYIFIPEIN